jgi:tetratricopeptide (TPR) repeat protein/two-component sensor histidine kinase
VNTGPEKDAAIAGFDAATHAPVKIATALPESEVDAARTARGSGDEAYQMGDLDCAREYYVSAISADPKSVRAHHNLATVYLSEGRPDEARKVLEESITLFPESSDLRYKLGVSFLRLSDPDNATTAFNTALALDADHLDARFQLALLYARGAAPASKDRARAIETLESILEATSRGLPYENLDRVCFLLASFLDDFADQRNRAIEVYRLGLKADPLFAPGHNNLGVLLMQEGQTIPALGSFKIAIHLQPDYTLPYRNLARLLFDHTSPVQMEEEYATLSDEFGPQGPAVLAKLSLELIDLGRGQVYESLYTHGHRIKNLMGLSGNRLRRIARDLDKGESVTDRLTTLVGEQEQVYDQWVAYLRTMKPDTINPTLVHIPGLIRETVMALEAQHPDRHISFATEERVPQVKADAVMLREAFNNLVLNALQATELDGHVSVQTGFDPQRTSVFIEVEDDGPGIPEAEQNRIFDPGFSTREKGNGYGLSICARIVSAHRGSLRLISQEGAGAVFRIDLPMDFEVMSEEETIRWQRPSGDGSSHPIAEEFLE